METIKALVTIGYHYGELEWGRIVREEYKLRALKGNRNIEFYEVKNSNVETGVGCKNSVQEIKKTINSKKVNLWIDIHCGIGFTTSGFDGIYGYIKRKKKIIDEMRKLDFSVINLNRKDIADLDIIDNIGIPYALIDPYFTKEDYDKKENGWCGGLEKTLSLINQVYDIHTRITSNL